MCKIPRSLPWIRSWCKLLSGTGNVIPQCLGIETQDKHKETMIHKCIQHFGSKFEGGPRGQKSDPEFGSMLGSSLWGRLWPLFGALWALCWLWAAAGSEGMFLCTRHPRPKSGESLLESFGMVLAALKAKNKTNTDLTPRIRAGSGQKNVTFKGQWPSGPYPQTREGGPRRKSEIA